MAKLVEMVKNSPLVKKKGYHVLDSMQNDPFVKGITFKLQHYASAEVTDKQNTPSVQETVREVYEKGRSSKSLRKMVLTVRAQCLTVTDTSTNIADTYPIFLVAYCGGHGEFEECFYFIHKTKLDKVMMVEVFRCSSAEKVRAITLTVAKAFNISYKAWVMKKKQKEKSVAEKAKNVSGNESPAMKRKVLQPQGQSNLARMAPGVVTGGTYTPPVARKPPSGPPEGQSRGRSGSFGDKADLKNPALVQVTAFNERTGSSHNVTVTDDFDLEFQALAESRTQPEVLRTSFVEEETDAFNLDSIMAHIDQDAN